MSLRTLSRSAAQCPLGHSNTVNIIQNLHTLGNRDAVCLMVNSNLPLCGQTDQSCLMRPWNILFGWNLVITQMCTANALQDRFWPRVCGSWAFSKHLSGCHQNVFYLPMVSPHFSSPVSRASRRMLEGFVFLNHSLSFSQSIQLSACYHCHCHHLQQSETPLRLHLPLPLLQSARQNSSN